MDIVIIVECPWNGIVVHVPKLVFNKQTPCVFLFASVTVYKISETCERRQCHVQINWNTANLKTHCACLIRKPSTLVPSRPPTCEHPLTKNIVYAEVCYHQLSISLRHHANSTGIVKLYIGSNYIHMKRVGLSSWAKFLSVKNQCTFKPLTFQYSLFAYKQVYDQCHAIKEVAL